jgi:hypothetical protein
MNSIIVKVQITAADINVTGRNQRLQSAYIQTRQPKEYYYKELLFGS